MQTIPKGERTMNTESKSSIRQLKIHVRVLNDRYCHPMCQGFCGAPSDPNGLGRCGVFDSGSFYLKPEEFEGETWFVRCIRCKQYED